MEGKLSRKSYTREFKLKVLAEYKTSNNMYQVCKKHGLNSKTVSRWVSSEDKIRESSKGSKRIVCCRKPEHPDVEAALMEEFKELRKKGLKVKAFWFKIRAKQLLSTKQHVQSFSRMV